MKAILKLLSSFLIFTSGSSADSFNSAAGQIHSDDSEGFIQISSGFSRLPTAQTLLGVRSSFLNPDSDGDGHPDILELDNDDDGLADNDELFTHSTDHNDPDSDDDTMTDGYEVENNLNPLADDRNADNDGDGFSNLQEFERGTSAGVYKIELKAGWNLISIARVPTYNTIDLILKGFNSGAVWYWEDGLFRVATRMQPMKGYWVYAPIDKNIEVTIP
jgi:hypothetical protein